MSSLRALFQSFPKDASWSLFLALGMLPATIRAVPDTLIRVDASKPVIPTSPSFYGIFYEEINRAGDGGLYAELIRNRSFEDTVTPERCSYGSGLVTSPTGWSQSFPEPETVEAWTLVKPDGAEISMQLDKRELATQARLRSLRVDLRNDHPQGAGVENSGFWGIPVVDGKAYRLSLSTKAAPGSQGALSAELIARDGRVLARADLGSPGDSWNRKEVQLRATGTDSQAVLRITTKAAGTLWLDTVSLFPAETFHGRANGLRPDLVQRLENLKPNFMRFPGGCIVEGFSRETIWHWKNTVGEITDRKGHYLLWSYRTTGGLGFHEFLQLCEDLKMDPMFVVNCGMTCQGRNGELIEGSALQELVQEALDGVEYANGPVTSKWGALRATNGHPAPFKLKYLEIGNENYGPEYEKRYALFYDAVHVRYPELLLISNSWVKSAPMQIVDEHFYPDPDFFIAHHDHYDTQDRKGPKIYVGEYAAPQGAGAGNLRAALGEAAFLTGLERNQDIVTMTSYAPLFANVQSKAWQPDAIYFDNHRSFVTPSYLVQQMFAENRGDEVIPIQVSTPKRPYFRPGVSGIEAVSGCVDLRDVTVEGDHRAAFNLDPAGQASQFETNGGQWGFVDGALRCASEAGAYIRFPKTKAGDTLFRTKVRFGGDDASVRLRVRDNERRQENRDYCTLTLGGNGRLRLSFDHTVGWSAEKLGDCDLGSLKIQHWYDVSVETQGSTLECRIDGKLVLTAKMRELPAVTAVITREKKSGTVIIKTVNTTSDAREVSFDLSILSPLALGGTELLLSSAKLDDENSFEAPLTVSPQTRKAVGLGNKFTRTLVPNSVSILRIETK